MVSQLHIFFFLLLYRLSSLPPPRVMNVTAPTCVIKMPLRILPYGETDRRHIQGILAVHVLEYTVIYQVSR